MQIKGGKKHLSTKQMKKKHKQCNTHAQRKTKKQTKSKQMRSKTFWSLPLHLFAFFCDCFSFFVRFLEKTQQQSPQNKQTKRTNIAHKMHNHGKKTQKNKVVCEMWLCMCIFCAFCSLLFCVCLNCCFAFCLPFLGSLCKFCAFLYALFLTSCFFLAFFMLFFAFPCYHF